MRLRRSPSRNLLRRPDAILLWLWFSLGCHPQVVGSGSSNGDSASTQQGAIAGSVVGDSGPVRRVVVPQHTGPGDTITNLSIALSDQRSGAPPAYVVVIAPDGKQTGMRPNWRTPREEISGARYIVPLAPTDTTSEPPMDIIPQLMFSPIAGARYMVLISGVQPRPYTFSIRAQRQSGRAFGLGEWNNQTAPGAVDTVLLDIGPGRDTAVATRPASAR